MGNCFGTVYPDDGKGMAVFDQTLELGPGVSLRQVIDILYDDKVKRALKWIDLPEDERTRQTVPVATGVANLLFSELVSAGGKRRVRRYYFIAKEKLQAVQGAIEEVVE